MLDSPLGQPLSRSSLVFLLVLDPQLHTPWISSPNHHLLFTAHAHTIDACSVVIPMLRHLYLISLSGPYLEISVFSLTPHIHRPMTILVSTRWSATSFSFLTGQISLPCNILLHTTTVQLSSHNQWYVLIGKQWYQLPELIPTNSNSVLQISASPSTLCMSPR